MYSVFVGCWLMVFVDGVVVVGVFAAKSAELSCFRDRRDDDGVYPKVHTNLYMRSYVYT